MIAVGGPERLRPGDVLIHGSRGGAIVDEVTPLGTWLLLTERLDRSEVCLSPVELADGWRLAIPGGLFELSVLQPEEATTRVNERPGESLRALSEELGGPVDRELAATWLVSRGLIGPGRTMAWWSEALGSARQLAGCEVVDDRVSVASRPAPEGGLDCGALDEMAVRQRFDAVGAAPRARQVELLQEAIDLGKADLAAFLLRWVDEPPAALTDGLDRLASCGHRGLARRLACMAPQVMASALLADAQLHGNDGLVGDVLSALPPRRQSVQLMEMLALAMHEDDARDLIEGLLDDTGSLGTLCERFDGEADPRGQLQVPGDGRWDAALAWLRSRSADTTMEMPSLHPTPLLRDSGRLSARDAFSVAISLARALARRHAQGRTGGVRSARLFRAEWRIELGPDEMGHPAQDVRDGMRLVLDLLVGRLAGPGPVTDDELLAHLVQLAPEVPVDLVGVAVRALDPDPLRRIDGGQALWLELEKARVTHKVRTELTPRPGGTLRVGFDTHIGALKARLGQTNQDAVFFHQHGPVSLLLVADGISISSAGTGNLASALLVQAVANRWEEGAAQLADADEPAIRQFLRDALEAGNDSVCETAMRMAHGDLSRHIPMGTTVVAALVRGGRVWIASLGDSRAYLVGSSGVVQLTGDGNLQGDWFRQRQGGQDAPIEADGAALTSYVGHFDTEDVAQAVEPQMLSLTLLSQESLLLCSDGFTDYAAQDSASLARLILEATAEPSDPSKACRRLVNAANAGGGGDNISVVLAHFRAWT